MSTRMCRKTDHKKADFISGFYICGSDGKNPNLDRPKIWSELPDYLNTIHTVPIIAYVCFYSIFFLFEKDVRQ